MSARKLSTAEQSGANMTDGVRRGIEDARDTAKRNLDYFDREIPKVERDIANLTAKLAEMREERATNEATFAEAEAMLNGR